jgi:four helix bundle protein
MNKNATRQFDHEKLDVYQAAIEFVTFANEIIQQLPRGRAYLAEQLQRAATSIVLNIAEGAGEFSKKDKSRFYRIARRSATECAAILDVCQRVAEVDPAKYQTGRDLLLRIVAMLTRMVVYRRQSGSGSLTGTGRGPRSQ